MAAYVASLGPGPPIPTNLDYQSADTAFGGALFRTNCAQCHNFSGSGGALTYGKFAPSLSEADPEADLRGHDHRPGEHAGLRRPADHAGPEAGDHQLHPHLRTEPNPGGAALGRVGPVSEGVVGWLVGIGVLVLVTMWIGSRA